MFDDESVLNPVWLHDKHLNWAQQVITDLIFQVQCKDICDDLCILSVMFYFLARCCHPGFLGFFSQHNSCLVSELDIRSFKI